MKRQKRKSIHTTRHALPATGKMAVICGSVLAMAAQGADSAKAPGGTFQKPKWLTDLSLGIKEGFDDNVLLVANQNPGMDPQSSWVTTVSPKIGFNFVPLLGEQKVLQSLSLSYAPDFAIYHGASSESFNAHKIGNGIKGKSGNVTFALDNAFLFNDGSSVAPTYALDQSAVAANQADKNRSAYATAVARERRKQVQDRASFVLQYDVNKFFIRPTASLLYYDLMTDLHSGAAAPFKGYQNYSDRYDVNGGVDFGYKFVPTVAATLGYRYGHQYQQALPHSVDTLMVNGQQAHASADYQRVLAGLEGQPWKWLTAKAAVGPEFRKYCSAAPVADDNTVDYYAEAALTATVTPSQTVSLTYKHWQWVSSTGKLAYEDNTCALAYHWNATKQLGFDLGAKYVESDYRSSSAALTGHTPTAAGQSERDDAVCTFSLGVGYAFTPRWSASLAYNYDLGLNLQDNLPASAFEKYREFDHQLVSLATVFKF